MNSFKAFVTISVVYFILLLSNMYSQEILDKGRFSGFMFGDYYYNILRDENVASLPFANFKDPQDQNGFEFRRIYFTYDYQISPDFNSRFRVEVEQFSLLTNNKISAFVKDAFLQWKDIFQRVDLIFGIQPTPTFDISEYVWENRHLEMTIIDLYGFISSRDFGISLKGKIDGNGTFNYHFMFGNGSGNRPETDRYKTLYLNFLYKPNSNIYLNMSYYRKYQRPIQNKYFISQILKKDEDLFSIFYSYKHRQRFKIGFEGFYNFVRNNFDDSLTKSYYNRNMLGLSFFAIFYLSNKFNFVARYDYFDPNILNEFKSDRRFLFLFGLNYKPIDKVYIAPALLIESFEKTAARNFKPSVTSRLVFFYIF